MNANRALAAALLGWAIGTSLYVALPQTALYWIVPQFLLRRLFRGELHWGLEGNPHVSLVVVLCALAGLAGLGWLVLCACGLRRLPAAAVPAVALVCGMAVLIVPLELLAIGKGLYAWPVIAVVAAAAVGGFLLRDRFAARAGEPPPEPEIAPGHPVLRWGAWAFVGLLALLSLFHAVLFPVTYWDSLIYYVHYARLTAAEHGFPVLVQGQVGLGLGANYPHLYPLLQSTFAVLTGKWTPGYGQAIPPLCCLAAVLVVYRLVAERHRSETVGLLSALLFYAVPYGFFYTIYASDYCLAVLIAAVLLYVLHRTERDPRPGPLVVAGACCALAPHLNYLMWVLWLPFLVFVGHALRAGRLRARAAAVLCTVCLLAASTWYVRNWAVTGNPVYAFFPGVFGGKHIDPEVLDSCKNEWTANGDGIGTYVRPWGNTLWNRIRYTPRYLLWDAGGIDAQGIFRPGTAYKLSSLLPAFALPGLLLMLGTVGWRRPVCRFRLAALLFLATLLFYQYVLAGLYLYHLLAGLPVLALAAGEALDFLHRQLGRAGSAAAAAAVSIGLVCPGLGCAVMGPKFHSPFLPQWPFAGRAPAVTLPLVYPDAVPMWAFLNDCLAAQSPLILTHENRHLYLYPTVRLIHLDDYRIWDWYGRDFETEVLPHLRELGVTHYVRVPNEKNHPIVARLGHGAYFTPARGDLLFFRSGGYELYRMPWTAGTPAADAAPLP